MSHAHPDEHHDEAEVTKTPEHFDDHTDPEVTETPIIDPIPTPEPRKVELVLVQAGEPPYNVKPMVLKPLSVVPICPRMYGNRGFSILCKTNARNVKAFFHVDGKLFRTDRQEPFYLNGNKGDRIFQYRELAERKVLRVGCKISGMKIVHLYVIQSCNSHFKKL